MAVQRTAVAWAVRTVTGPFALIGAAGYAAATVGDAGPARWILLAGGLAASGVHQYRLMTGGHPSVDPGDVPAGDLAEARTSLKFGVAGTLEQLAFARGVRHVRVEMRGARAGEPVSVEGVAELTFRADIMTTVEMDNGGVDIDQFVEEDVNVTVTVVLEAHPDEGAQRIVDVCRHAHSTATTADVALTTTVKGELEWLSVECGDGVGALLER